MKPRESFKGRPPGFSYKKLRGGEVTLTADQVAVESLAEKFGTPLYVYSATTLRERLARFKRAFRSVPHTVCYAMKANSNLSILRLLAGLGCGFDVVSGGELERVLAADRKAAKRVVFSGVGKTAEEMDLALRAGILLFNMESEPEMELLAERAGRMKKTARVAFRVNPDVDAETHPYISTGLREHKFGIPIQDAPELYAMAAKQRWLRTAGVSVHIGSQITTVAPFLAAMERVAELVQTLRTQDHEIEYVDAGGGLGIPYHEETSDVDFDLKSFERVTEKYGKAVLAPIRKLKAHLLLEPGRSIVGPAGALISRVVFRKENGKKNFVIVDAGMNDLIRPVLYGAYHSIVPVTMNPDVPVHTVDVVGPICESGDFLARDRALPQVESGDLLAILDAGAYSMALASNYNSRRRPAELLVDGRRVKIIRKREKFADLIRAES